MTKYRHRINEREDAANVIVVAEEDDGSLKTYHADDRNENFGEILRRLNNKDYGDRFLTLFSMEEKFKDVFSTVEGRVSIAYGQVYFDDEPIHSVLSDHIIRALNDENVQAYTLIKFWENIAANPSEDSRNAIFDWLKSSHFTITQDGMIVGYKGLREDFTSINAGPGIVNGEEVNGHLDNAVGNVVEIDRALVDPNRNAYCSSGLHVGTWGYAKDFARGAVVAVHVNPRDVVMVPPDCGGQKMRVVRYVVVRQVTGQYGDAVLNDNDWKAE